MQEERDAAEEVKRDKPILVVLGNPPYNAFAGTSAKEEGGIVDVYKEGLIKDWGIKKFNLDDLYIRFFRLAERRIAEKTGKGIVCFISNFSYLSDLFRCDARTFLARISTILVRFAERRQPRDWKADAPKESPTQAVFSTPYNPKVFRVGIQRLDFSRASANAR